MNKYTTRRKDSLSPQELGRILSLFKTNDIPIFQKRWDYYDGKQSITYRLPTDIGKPNNKIVANFVESIVSTYEGYIEGIATTYEAGDASNGFEELLDIFNYNDIADADAELLRTALIFGRAPEICYVDSDAQQRFRVLDPRSVIPVYDDTLNEDLLFAIRFWENNFVEDNGTTYTVEVYSNTTITTYRSHAGFTSFEFIEERPHFFTQVPITFFKLNSEEKGIADNIFALNDAYNSLLSDSIDDADAFADAYLLLKGCVAEEDDLEAMKKHKVLMLDNDADAEYLVKDASKTATDDLLSTVEAKIRELSACPDFNNETFGTSSGIAIRYRLMAMENKASAICSNMKKALQRRIELLSDIMSLTHSEAFWRDITIRFTRNIPIDNTETINIVNSLRGFVSDETLLGLLPFVEDVEKELERISNENNALIYEAMRNDNEEI